MKVIVTFYKEYNSKNEEEFVSHLSRYIKVSVIVIFSRNKKVNMIVGFSKEVKATLHCDR